MDNTAILPTEAAVFPEKKPLERVFELLGGPTGVLKALRAAGIEIKTPWAVNKWLRAGRLPRTEYTGETNYAQVLERAVGGQVTAAAMLEQGKRRDATSQ